MTNTASFDYSGSRVLVTGGTSGIGYGIASAFANAGASVIVTGTRDSAANYDDVDLSAMEFRSLKMQDTEAVKQLGSELDALDILINNAGASFPGGDEWTHEGFDASVELNLLSAFHMTKACFEHLKASQLAGGASIISIASITSYFANELVPGYGAAKSGILGMTRSMALTWAEHGIRANAIAAGLIETRMTSAMKDIPETNDPIIEQTPLKRWGTPQDIAGVALYMCSEQASFLTGQTLIVDGGKCLPA